MTKKVYIVEAHYAYEGGSVDKVFESYEEADDYASLMNAVEANLVYTIHEKDLLNTETDLKYFLTYFYSVGRYKSGQIYCDYELSIVDSIGKTPQEFESLKKESKYTYETDFFGEKEFSKTFVLESSAKDIRNNLETFQTDVAEEAGNKFEVFESLLQDPEMTKEKALEIINSEKETIKHENSL